MQDNQFLALWIPAIGLHAAHQLEESISFFDWYIQNAANIPRWAMIVSVHNATTWVQHPGWFLLGSVAQLVAVSLVAIMFRHREAMTRSLLLLYIAGLTWFFCWHIITAWFAHSYPPVMVTCIGGLYLIPRWFKSLLSPRDS